MIMHQFTWAKLKSPQVGTIHMETIRPIRESLAARGIVHPEQQLEDAWLYLTPFTYSMDFPWRDDGFERYELYAEYLSGRGEIRLNGQFVHAFDTGEARADVTAFLEAENRLEIVFLPFLPETPTARYDSGVYGEICIRGTNFLTLTGFSVEPANERFMNARVDFLCHSSGWYDFVYTLSREDGGLVKKQTFSKKLRALASGVVHELPISGDPARLRLTVERGGIASDEWEAGVKWRAAASALCAVSADALYSGGPDKSGILHCAQFKGRAPSLLPRRLSESMLILRKDGDVSPLNWPDPAHPLCGEMLDAAISQALIAGRRPLLMPPGGEDVASAAGEKLISRLRLPHAFAGRDENSALFPGSSQTFEIWFAGDDRAPYPLSVSATAYTAEGKPLSSRAFTACGDALIKLGDMSFIVPESEDCVLLRVATTGFAGGEAAIHDAFFFRGGLRNARELPSIGEIHTE